MSDKRKICVVITARPSYSRIKSALTAIKSHSQLELQIVVAASALLDRYGTAFKYIEQDGFKIDAKVFNVLEGENLTAQAKTTGLGILELATVFENLKPDAVVTIADRFETMATAVAASYMNIPLIHVQGGEVTGNIDEKVRHAITKLSDLHLVSSEDAMLRVVKLGEDPAYVVVTGCPSIDMAAEVVADKSTVINPILKYGGVGTELLNLDNFIIVLQHPVTTEYEDSRHQIEQTLNAVIEMDISCLWFWPNVDAGSDGTSKGIRAFREKHPDAKIHFFKSVEPEDFLRLLKVAKCLVGNSSTGIRECSYLGTPVVNIGSRQEGRVQAQNVINVDHDKEEIKAAIVKQMLHGRFVKEELYGDGKAGEKIANTIAKVNLRIDKKILY
jgi:UDP-hydrolysing UDP-N-acetyl-D-glucosamine 2-epimerase